MNATTAADTVFSPLREPAYRRLFAAQATSLVGTGLGTVALALLAFDLAGADAGAVLGTALAIKMVAYITIAPLVGAIAHRVARKGTLVALDLVRAAVVALLPFVDQVWQIYVLIFLISACAAGFTPLFQATVPDLLGHGRQYMRALSLSRAAYELENLLSPTVAALLLVVTGFSELFYVNAATFLVSAALVLATRLPHPTPPERPAGLLGNLAFGLESYLRTPHLRGLLLVTFAAALGGAMIIVNSVVYVRGLLGLSDSMTAVAFMASGAGAMIVALGLPRLTEKIALRPLMAVGGGITALALVAGAALPGLAGLLGLWFVIAAAGALVQTPAGRLIAASCREGDRPAFFSAHFSLTHAGWLAGYLVAGWLGSAMGLAVTFAVAAGGALAATIAGILIWPQEAREGAPALEHEHGPMEHTHLHFHDSHHRHAHEGWEGPEPHSHPHRHGRMRHSHPFVIDLHHPSWPK